MEAKRLMEYLVSAEGLIKAATALLVALLALSAKLTDFLGNSLVAFGVPQQRASLATNALSVVLLLLASLLLWRGYRRFRRESRVVRPEAFILVPATPATLVGRADDLRNLHKLVRNHRIVLLDGESGCGKSALLEAGLAPELRTADGLFPIFVRDWGEDPVRGPLASMLGALHDATNHEQRTFLGWQQPDLAADADTLLYTLATRLGTFVEGTHRTLLLIADQLDDYQARHRPAFIGEQGAWIAPDALAAVNPFWSLVRDQLTRGTLHLLAVSRSDLASGLSCFRFLPGDRVAPYPLPKVDLSFLHQLMEGIAPPTAEPPAVSNPENGWNDLRDRLEADFRLRGAVLMQQVRTVLLGVAQLPVITPRAYRRAGGMQGVETLVIRSALEAAAGPAGGGAAGLHAARTLLGALVLQPGPDQVPKAQRQSFDILATLVGGSALASAALVVLASREIVHPAGGDGAEPAWQLDHDYLARPVLAEARAADRWGTSLNEGFDRFRNAGDGWRTRWRALLPMGTQARLLWEYLRGRLRYGEAAPYAGVSAVKPLVAFVLLAFLLGGAAAVRREFALEGRAKAVAERFTTDPPATVMEVWTAPPAERAHLLAFLERSNLVPAAITAGWAAAHAGADPAQAALAAHLVRQNVADPDETRRSRDAPDQYIGLVHRLSPGHRTVELTLLANQIASAPEQPGSAVRLAAVFAAAAPVADDNGIVEVGARAIRQNLQSTTNPAERTMLANAYADTAAALDAQSSAAELDAGIAALDDAIPATQNIEIAYASLALKRGSPAVLLKAGNLLRKRLSMNDRDVKHAYGDMLATLSGPLLQAELSALHEGLLADPIYARRTTFADAYTTAVGHVEDLAFLRSEAEKLIASLSEPDRVEADTTVAPALVAVAVRLAGHGGPELADRAAHALADRSKAEPRVWKEEHYGQQFAEVAAVLPKPENRTQASYFLGNQLLRGGSSDARSGFAAPFVKVASTLEDSTVLKKVASILLERITNLPDPAVTGDFRPFSHLLGSYADIVAALGQSPSRAAVAKRIRLLLQANAREGGNSAEGLAGLYGMFMPLGADDAQSEAEALLTDLEQDVTMPVPLDRDGTPLVGGEADARVREKVNDRRLALVTAFIRATKGLAGAYAERGERILRPWIESRSNRNLYKPYIELATRLRDPTTLKTAAQTLREAFTREAAASKGYPEPADIDALTEAYGKVAAQLGNDRNFLAQEANALWLLVDQPPNPADDSFADLYATMVGRITDPAYLSATVRIIYGRLLTAANADDAGAMATALAAVAGACLHLPEIARPLCPPIPEMVLTAAGHPFVRDSASLLAILEPATGHHYGSDLGAAVSDWAAKGGRPSALRPKAL